MRKFLFAFSIVFFVAAIVLGFCAFTSVQSYTLYSYKAQNAPLVISKKVDGDFTVMSLDERQTVINAYQDFTFDAIYSNSSNFSVSYGNPSPSTTSTPLYYSNFKFSGCMSANKDTLNRYGYTMAYGSLPQKDNQVCITQFAFDVYKTLGYSGKNGSSSEINRYADIIGKKISIDNYELEISGVIDTKLDKKFDILKEDIHEHKFLKSTKSSGYFSIFSDIHNTSHTALFITEYMVQDLFEMPYVEVQFFSLAEQKVTAAISYSFAEVRQPQITWANGKQALDTGEIILDKKLFRTLMLEKYSGPFPWSEKFNGFTYTEGTLTDDILLQMLDSKPILISYIPPLNLNLAVVGIWDNEQTLNNYGCIINNSLYSSQIDSAVMPDTGVVALVTPQQKKAANNSPLFSQSVSLDDNGYAAIVPYIPDKIISLQRTIIWGCFFASIVVSLITGVFAIRKRG